VAFLGILKGGIKPSSLRRLPRTLTLDFFSGPVEDDDDEEEEEEEDGFRDHLPTEDLPESRRFVSESRMTSKVSSLIASRGLLLFMRVDSAEG
jgi:hypothetical protein